MLERDWHIIQLLLRNKPAEDLEIIFWVRLLDSNDHPTKPEQRENPVAESNAAENDSQAKNGTIFFASTKGEFGFLSQWFESPFVGEEGEEFLSVGQ